MSLPNVSTMWMNTIIPSSGIWIWLMLSSLDPPFSSPHTTPNPTVTPQIPAFPISTTSSKISQFPADNAVPPPLNRNRVGHKEIRPWGSSMLARYISISVANVAKPSKVYPTYMIIYRTPTVRYQSETRKRFPNLERLWSFQSFRKYNYTS